MIRLDKTQEYFVKHPLIVTLIFPFVLGVLTVIYETLAEFWPNVFKGFDPKDEFFVFITSFITGVLWQIFCENAVLNRSINQKLAEKELFIAQKDFEIQKLSEERAKLREKFKNGIVNRSDKISIGIANFNNFLPYIPLYVAEHFGFFEEEDIVVEMKPHEDDLSAISAVGKRESHFGITDPIFIFNDSVKDQELRILAPFINKVAVWALSKTDLRVAPATAAKSKGGSRKPLKIVTYDPETTAHRISEKLALHLQKSHGITKPVIHPIQHDKSEQITKFFEREFVDGAAQFQSADILVFSEPEISYLEQELTGFMPKVPLHDLLFSKQDKFAFTAIVARRGSVEREREVCRRFLKAIRHAQLFVYSLPKFDGELADSKNAQWARVVEAVHSNIANCYPGGMLLSKEKIAQLVEELRSSSYFSSSLAYKDQWMEGLRSAYKLVYPSDYGDLNKRTVDVAKALGLVAI